MILYNQSTLKITIDPVDLPKDLKAYLIERESLVPNIRQNCHKAIIWAGKKNQPSEYCIVYLHSFTGSPKELHPLIEHLGQSLSANIFFQRLEGHGQTKEELESVSLNQWANNTWEAWEIANRIGKKIILVSTSTGSALASWLCARVQNIHSCIMISPNFMPKSSVIPLLSIPGMIHLITAVKGPYARHKKTNDQINQYFTTTYPRKAWLPMYRACLLANRISHKNIMTPLLILYTQWDEIISVSRIKQIFSKWGSDQKSLINIKEAHEHFLAGDIFSPDRTEDVKALIEDFIARVKTLN